MTTFEEAEARHNFESIGTFLKIVDKHHILVNGPGRSVDVLLRRDLSHVVNLDTDGEVPFCAVHEGELLFVGCNKGHLYSFNSTYGFHQRNFQKL